MRAVVLVGGFGTRLRPLTSATPKQMLPIVDRPMIEHVLAHLGRHGVDRGRSCRSASCPTPSSSAYPDGVCAGLQLHYAVEPEPLDTAGAIRFAARDAGIDERFVVVNGDVLTDLDVTRLVEFHDDHGAEAHDRPAPGGGSVGLRRGAHRRGRAGAGVRREAGRRAPRPTDLINAGTYVLEPSVLDRIPDGRKVSIERETFPAIVADGRLFALAGDTYWIDTGTPETYLRAQLDLVDGVRGAPWPAVSADATRRRGRVGRALGRRRRRLGRDGCQGARLGACCPARSSAPARWSTGSIVGPGPRSAPTPASPASRVLGEGAEVAPGEVLDGERR